MNRIKSVAISDNSWNTAIFIYVEINIAYKVYYYAEICINQAKVLLNRRILRLISLFSDILPVFVAFLSHFKQITYSTSLSFKPHTC